MHRAIPRLITLASILLGADVARAGSIPVPDTGSNPVQQIAFGGIGGTSNNTGVVLNTIWGHLLALAFAILGGLAILMVFYGGIQYITSSGSPDGAKKGRQTIINGITGVIVLTAAYAIIAVLYSIAHFIASKL